MTTPAGKALCAKLNEIGRAPFSGVSFPDIEYDVAAIEDQAATEVRRELLAKVEGLEKDPERDYEDVSWNAALAAVLRLLEDSDA